MLKEDGGRYQDAGVRLEPDSTGVGSMKAASTAPAQSGLSACYGGSRMRINVTVVIPHRDQAENSHPLFCDQPLTVERM